MKTLNNRFEFPLKNIAIETLSTHNNIFIVRDINDTTEHGNLAIYGIAWYDSAVTLKSYYHTDLSNVGTGDSGEWDEWIKKNWKEFCELNGIKKWKNSTWRTTYFPKKNCGVIDFLKWLKEK